MRGERAPLLRDVDRDVDVERARRNETTSSSSSSSSSALKPLFVVGVVGVVALAATRTSSRDAMGVVQTLLDGTHGMRGKTSERAMRREDINAMNDELGARDPFIVDGVNPATPDDDVGTTKYDIVGERMVEYTRPDVDDIEQGDSEDVTFTLRTACAQRRTLTFPVGAWEGVVGARVTTKRMSNDFLFKDAKEMQQIACGTYQTSLTIARGEQFGFYLYPLSDADNDVATVSDIGCVRRGDQRCPGFATPSALAEMHVCAKEYDYGNDTFYNRVWDGDGVTFVYGSCDVDCADAAPVECPGLQTDELPPRAVA